MKKNISINLQGMIFHIEEDGYDQLSQYLAAIKSYFAPYEGHEEITADIEARIAEIFFAKLSPTKQVITRDDVQALVAQMGSVKDFQTLEDEEAPYTAAPGTGYQKDYSTSAAFAGDNTAKRIFRDEKRKVVGGVAAGIANYLNMDPIGIRLGFVFLTVLFSIPGGFPAGLIIVAYLLCWVAFPKSYTLPETTTKKLFRNPEDKKLGGVASGIALYFGMDVAVIRLLFLISALIGGFGFLAYIILWIILPEASSITDYVQMQGNPVTLSSIEESLKTNLRMKDENGTESQLARIILFPVRLIAQVLQFLARVLNPIIIFLIALIRIFAGALLLFLAGVIIFGLFVMAATALNVIDGSSIIDFGDVPFSMFVNSFPTFGMVAGFFAILIPCLLLFMLGLGLLLKRFYLRATIGWSMFAIWILSIFVLVLSILQFRNDFRESGEYTTQKTFPVAAYETVVLQSRDTESFRNGRASLEIQSYPGNDIRLVQEFEAKGLTEAEAMRNARMVTYRSIQQDSVIILDNNFKFKPDAKYREQELNLKLLVPENKKLRLSRGISYMLVYGSFDRDFNDETEDKLWQVKNNKLICLNCPPPDTTSTNENVPPADPDWDAENEESSLNSPLKDEDEYGDETRSFNFNNFEYVDVGGIYHLRIRKGPTFSISARGEESDLRNLIINKNGNELEIKSKEKFFRFSFKDRNPVLITIEMPNLTELELSGAVKADVAGFNPDRFKLTESGAVQTALAINSRELEIASSGACETTLAGRGETLRVDASGACHLRAGRYQVAAADVELSGACDARVFVTQKLDAQVSGPSHLSYRGNPQTVNSDESGMGEIKRE